jgi:predicted HicB family RNase H-like nuclease
MKTEPAFLVRTDYDLHRAVKMKSQEVGMSVSELVRQWLRAWVAGNLPTPPPEKDTLYPEGD